MSVQTWRVSASEWGGGTHEYPLLERLELVVSLDALVLGQARVDRDGREVALAEQAVELGCARDGLDEDADLVKLERVEEVVELAVLGGLVEAHKVLLQTVQRELLLVVHVDLEGLQGVSEARCSSRRDLPSA